MFHQVNSAAFRSGYSRAGAAEASAAPPKKQRPQVLRGRVQDGARVPILSSTASLDGPRAPDAIVYVAPGIIHVGCRIASIVHAASVMPVSHAVTKMMRLQGMARIPDVSRGAEGCPTAFAKARDRVLHETPGRFWRVRRHSATMEDFAVVCPLVFAPTVIVGYIPGPLGLPSACIPV